MLQNQLKERLFQMRLKGLLNAYLRQQSDPSVKDLSFEERFGLLIDFEWTSRQNRRLARLLKESGMPGNACIEDIDFSARRNLDRKLIQLIQLRVAAASSKYHGFRADRRGKNLSLLCFRTCRLPDGLFGPLFPGIEIDGKVANSPW